MESVKYDFFEVVEKIEIKLIEALKQNLNWI